MSVTSEDDGAEDDGRLLDSSSSMHNRSYPRSSPSEASHQKQFPDQGPNDDNANDNDSDDKDEQASGSGTENDSDADEDDTDPLPPPPPVSQHAFAPPFYGRPPTPLPPSPSLTSLLRPSRPTTPDASEDEGGGGGHPGDPLPRARPKVPTYEYYGFVLYLFSSLSFLIYLLWSYLPSPFLHALGIYYYPNRWWSLAIPSFLVMLLVYIYVALAGYNVEILTLPLNSVETVVDEAAQVAVVDERGRIIRSGRRVDRDKVGKAEGMVRRKGSVRGASGGDGLDLDWREVWNEGTDAVMDVPLAGVCEVLYGEGRDWDSELEDDDVVITRV
ncbi:PIG-P-domain-containing protein [Chaetomium strumarium]|uniref:PIG-P-domain-containing protein n=1 Tax=Chaetomium strumarium TaxID=1170767 RepID=A0AAJ0H163_9PEZI|nr:PIG-P-domain-containing protein [Chaetomium strumarium]